MTSKDIKTKLDQIHAEVALEAESITAAIKKA